MLKLSFNVCCTDCQMIFDGYAMMRLSSIAPNKKFEIRFSTVPATPQTLVIYHSKSK